MACEILACCQFFNDKMKDMPNTAEYIKKKHCLGDFESCVRYRIYKEFGGDKIPLYLYPEDTEEVSKVLKCLRYKQRS
ncbi:MAG: hypothetical protein CXR30_02075 [Geobacter sp.]|nr:MAG: hypothetical protein CXR30_02075 [Geobacter sp.]